MTTAAIATVLGGRKKLGRRLETDTDLDRITYEGLPASSVSAMAEGLSVERKQLAKVVRISERTLSRRLASHSKLSVDESDRMVRVARVMAHAIDTLGTAEKASRWLQRPNLALGNDVPLDLLGTDTGRHLVEAVLYRIEYGVYS